MKAIARFIDFFLFTSLLTACCATGLCMATERLFMPRVPLAAPLHWLVLGSTILVYNSPRLLTGPYGRQQAGQRYRLWFRLLFAAGLCITIAGLWVMPATVQLCCMIPGTLAFAYFLPVLPFKSKKRIRDYGWLKIAVLTTVWTAATAIVPMIYWRRAIPAYPFEVLQRMAFIFALCVLFDLRDVQQDLANNIHTLPHKLGIANAYRLVHLSLLVFAALCVAQHLRYPAPGRLGAGLLTAAATGIVAAYLRRYPTERAYAALADGVMLLYAAAVLLL